MLEEYVIFDLMLEDHAMMDLERATISNLESRAVKGSMEG
jgi:hypothetical protein